MSNYHRLYISGAMYFFTVVTYNRNPLLLTGTSLSRLRSAFKYTMEKHPFEIVGIVILPDHLHCIWQLPNGDSDFSLRWQTIKRYYSIAQPINPNHRGEKNIWQRRFWEHMIKNDEDLNKHLDYIYYNPVKHGYVNAPCEWAFSSFKRDVGRGLYDINWGNIQFPNNNNLYVE
jgi:putative transposase